MSPAEWAEWRIWVGVVTMGVALAACASLWGAGDTAAVQADTAAQLACVAEAGTLAESRACRCAVMARYPEGPQCLADGGRP